MKLVLLYGGGVDSEAGVAVWGGVSKCSWCCLYGGGVGGGG